MFEGGNFKTSWFGFLEKEAIIYIVVDSINVGVELQIRSKAA
jgi:hypothetical protein